MSSWALSDISHEEICWNNARKGLPKNANCNSEISIMDMKLDVKLEQLLRAKEKQINDKCNK